VREVLCATLNVYLLVLFARVIMSWVPVRPGTGLANVQHVLAQLTEPVVGPIRRVLPPAGMFDLSTMVVFILIIIVQHILGCSSRIL
jgi:YggT family protein